VSDAKAKTVGAAKATGRPAKKRRRGRPPVPLWDEDERAAWQLPPAMRPSEWAEAYRTLGEGQTDTPGPWRNANAPYGRGMMDLPAAPGVEQVNIEKSAQIGASEVLRNLLGYWADLEPDPVGLALPDRVKGRRIIGNRVIPLFRETPRLRRLLSSRAHDVQKEEIRLDNGFLLHLMWSGSASSTSADPMRRVICDEVDKMALWAGAEPDPVGRTWKRTETYGERRCQVNLSTPTDQFSEIDKLVEASRFHLYYFVPCPHCGARQRLTFGQLKWPSAADGEGKGALADRIVADAAAWFECTACGKRIDEDRKAAMVRAGRWSTDDGEAMAARGELAAGTVDGNDVVDAEAVEAWPRGTRIGMRIWKAYRLLGAGWASIAAEFLRTGGELGKLFNFVTETLGEAFHQQVARAPADVFRGKVSRAALPEGVVPAWAAKLIAAVDTQIDHFYLVLRAWGPEMRSQRVWHGRVSTFAEIERLCFGRVWKCEDEGLGAFGVELVGIDSGGTRDRDADSSRTMEVYRWCQKFTAVARALKGAAKPRSGQYVWRGKGFLAPPEGVSRPVKRKLEVPLYWLAEGHWQDVLADLIVRGVGDEDDAELWMLNTRADDEYDRHLANARKVVVSTRGRPEEKWTKVHSGAREDYRDCEKYQCALAYMAGVQTLPSVEECQALRRQLVANRAEAERAARKRQNEPRDPWRPTSF